MPSGANTMRNSPPCTSKNTVRPDVADRAALLPPNASVPSCTVCPYQYHRFVIAPTTVNVSAAPALWLTSSRKRSSIAFGSLQRWLPTTVLQAPLCWLANVAALDDSDLIIIHTV